MKEILEFKRGKPKKTNETIIVNYVTKEQAREALKKNMDLIKYNITRIMIAKNISQSELSRSTESEQQHISYILKKNNKGITINVLSRIAVALDVKLYELIK